MGNKLKTARAWLVHAYTAAGLIAAFAAFQAMLAGNVQTVFLWLGAALFIDATDGPFARRWQVTKWTPGFSGRKLDDIVDYINYTLIPVLLIYTSGMVEGPGTAVLPLVLIASAYGFCQTDAKTEDGFFTGFPSYWNILVFYLFLLDTGPGLTALVLGLFAVLVFVPVKYLTWKSPILPGLTLALSVIWSVSLVGLLIWFETAPAWAVRVSLLFPLYHLGASFYYSLHSSSRKVKEN
jgi:phosphatidylcholine synthase